MTILVIAEHDNASIKAATLNTRCGGAEDRWRYSRAGGGPQRAGRSADAAAKIAGVTKVLLADAPQLAAGLGGEHRGDGAERSRRTIRTSSRRLPLTARTSRRASPRSWTSRRSATSRPSIAPIRSSARSTPATRSRRCNRAIRSRSSPCVRRVSIRWRPKAAAQRSRRSKRQRNAASRSS